MSSRFWLQINNVDPEFLKVSLVTQNSKSKTENDFNLHQLLPVVFLLLPVNTSDALKSVFLLLPGDTLSPVLLCDWYEVGGARAR